MKPQDRPFVSLIVPIYNVEMYISECVMSLVHQTYENIKIILVDDGSPDNSGAIIDELAGYDKRIHVIHKENGGVSSARNAGIAAAEGKYIMFVDGDDYVEPDYVSYFVSMMEGYDGEIGVGRNAFTRDETEQPVDSIKVLDALDIVEGIYLNHFGVAVWNKIYRRDVISRCALLFNTDFWYGEGMLFNIQYLQYVGRAVVGERKVYHVRPNPESATRKFNLKSQYCGLRSMLYQKDHWIKTNRRVKIAWEYHYRMYAKSILQGLIVTNSRIKYRKLFRESIHILRSNLRIPIQAELSARMKENSILLAICPTQYIRDELGIVHEKGDHSDIISRKMLAFARKISGRIPAEKKARFFERAKVYYQSHYRPVYLENSLL